MRVIRQVDVFPVNLPISRSFVFASGSAGHCGGTAGIVYVKVTDSSGEVGWGEGRPMPSWGYETLESVASTLRLYLIPAVVGQAIWDRMGLHSRMSKAIGRGPSTGQPIAKAALDMALHDLCAKAAGISLRELLGGASKVPPLDLSWTCTSHSETSATEDVEEGLKLGYRHFNFKAAVTPQTDIAVARAIQARAPADAFLWADCNQGYTLPDAVRVAQSFELSGVKLLEQPFPADQPNLLHELRKRTSIPLAIDEASVSPSDFFQHVRTGLTDFLVVKLTRTGGIWPTLEQLGVARSAGLPVVVSGLTDSSLTKVAAAQVAAAFSVRFPLALNGSQFLDDSSVFPDKGRWEHNGQIHLDETPGIGVQPSEEALRSLAVNV
ncbi:MAG: enolase C-terminal domain-like protein [Opitutus sp.]